MQQTQVRVYRTIGPLVFILPEIEPNGELEVYQCIGVNPTVLVIHSPFSKKFSEYETAWPMKVAFMGRGNVSLLQFAKSWSLKYSKNRTSEPIFTKPDM